MEGIKMNVPSGEPERAITPKKAAGPPEGGRCQRVSLGGKKAPGAAEVVKKLRTNNQQTPAGQEAVEKKVKSPGDKGSNLWISKRKKRVGAVAAQRK